MPTLFDKNPFLKYFEKLDHMVLKHMSGAFKKWKFLGIK